MKSTLIRVVAIAIKLIGQKIGEALAVRNFEEVARLRTINFRLISVNDSMKLNPHHVPRPAFIYEVLTEAVNVHRAAGESDLAFADFDPSLWAIGASVTRQEEFEQLLELSAELAVHQCEALKFCDQLDEAREFDELAHEIRSRRYLKLTAITSPSRSDWFEWACSMLCVAYLATIADSERYADVQLTRESATATY